LVRGAGSGVLPDVHHEAKTIRGGAYNRTCRVRKLIPSTS
jgi:hypothetical protein